MDCVSRKNRLGFEEFESVRERRRTTSRRATCRSVALWLLVCLACGLAPAAWGDISGFVRETGTMDPIAGARVHLQADVGGPEVLTAADGSFTLPVNPPAGVVITASVEYDPSAGANYNTSGAQAMNGDTDVLITLDLIPLAENTDYMPLPVDACGGCHPQQEADWRMSNHSFAAIDTWVLDLFSGTGTPGGSAGYVFTETHDPGETGFCATCHAPMADAMDPGNVMLDEVTDEALLNGVSCVGCHQIDSSTGDVNALHLLGNSTYRFPQGPTDQYVWGPLDDVFVAGMSASYSPFFEESRICASCHQYNNPDTGAPGQSTYTEWLASPWAMGPDARTCQDCHMPEIGDGQVCIIGPERDSSQRHSHRFIGATPDTLTDAILLDAMATANGATIEVRAEVTNQGAGHDFPTGVSIRNALLVIEATYQGTPLTQVSGPTIPFWADDDVPGRGDGDYAGEPGKGFARVLEGRINGEGPVERPVLFIDAEGVFSDTKIPSGETDVTEVVLAVPPGTPDGAVIDVQARLLYRRAFRATAVTKGWTETPQGGPIEIEVAAVDLQVPVSGVSPLEIPSLNQLGLLLLALLLAGVAVRKLTR